MSASPEGKKPDKRPDREPDKRRAGRDSAKVRGHVELLAALGKSLHSAGLPAHRLEETLHETAERLGVPVQVFSHPTGLMMSVGDEADPITTLLRADASAVHLERLTRLSRIGRAVSRGALTPPQARRQIETLMHAPPRWGRTAAIVAYVLSAGSFAVFFGGGVPEIVTAITVGFAVGVIAVILRELRASPRLYELLGATAAATIANGVYAFVPGFVEWIPLASGLIILLPGFSLVDGVDELAHGHLTSGAARLAGVGVVLLAMSFGAVVGLAMIPGEIGEPTANTTEGISHWWKIPALVTVSLGSTIRFRARWVDFWPALVGSTVAFFGAELSRELLDSLARPFLASLLLGIAANAYHQIFRRPPQLVSVPGLALLVPGAFGVRSIAALLNEDTTVGVDIAFHMMLVAMALVTGLLFSRAFFREPRH